VDKKSVLVRIDPALHIEAKKQIADMQVPGGLSAIVEQLLRLWVKPKEKQEKIS
jgi:hypothetical protein